MIRRLRSVAALGAVLGALLLGTAEARAWGAEAHRAIALIADRVLQQSDAAAHRKVHELLAADKNNGFTKNDIASEATWADVLRDKSEEARYATVLWHAVRLNAANPDLTTACHGRSPLPVGYPASHGPRDNCAVDKVEQFVAELQNPETSSGERIAALRFLLNLVADLNDPLLTIDRGDRGGQCVALQVGAAKAPVRLVTYWENTLVGEVIGRDPQKAAARIVSELKPEDVQKWAANTPQSWAEESYEAAKSVVYAFAGEPPAGKFAFPAAQGEKDPCGEVDVYRAGPEYETSNLAAIKQLLARAGVRLAIVLRDNFK